MFDVNETLLDMGSLGPHFERLFGDTSARQAWSGQFLQLWLTETVTAPDVRVRVEGWEVIYLEAGTAD